jgi:hypothetical protein
MALTRSVLCLQQNGLPARVGARHRCVAHLRQRTDLLRS